jgi:hypothetical protein
MGKNWLIRTKSNHILGPVSKEKVLELYQNASIKPDDEICSGNGYWFYIRESELVDKYLKGHATQSFNPISEAKDILTSPVPEFDPEQEPAELDDITRVGGINLKDVQESDKPAAKEAPLEVPQKKKLKSESQSKQSDIPKKKPQPQNWFKYLGIAIFIVLFMMIYFRKSILKSFFNSSALSGLILSNAHAQDENPEKKKRLLESDFVIDEVTFKPSIGIEGFRVVSSFDIETFTCAKLESQVFQLGVILYPLDLVNEKFLISIRNCMLKLSEAHPVKKWLKAQAKVPKPSPKEQEKIDFLNEILNTQFNLITDQKAKNKVIALLAETPDSTNLEKLLKSYLYLMIGNITRSDKILKDMMTEPPRYFYQGFTMNGSVYHRLTLTHLEKVMRKFSRHPADRLTFYLFNQYIKSFLNKSDLIELVDDLEMEGMSEKIKLSYTERIAPELVGFVRLNSMGEKRRIKILRQPRYSLEMQSLWIWPFMDVNPLISEAMAGPVKVLDETDPIWAIYVLEDEKLADLYFKKGGIPITRRRSSLRSHLEVKADYMLTLYKLIEIGDINEDLIQNVSRFMQQHDG